MDSNEQDHSTPRAAETPASPVPDREAIKSRLRARLAQAEAEANPSRVLIDNFKAQWRWSGIEADQPVELQQLAPKAPDEERGDTLRARNRHDASTGEYRPMNRYARVRGLRQALVLLAHAADNFQVQGLYTLGNRLKRAVADKAKADVWLSFSKDGGTIDGDIATRCVLMLDVDPKRQDGVKDISATESERQLAIERALDLYADLAKILGSEQHIAFVSSGNGAQVHVRVDLPNTSEVTQAIKRLLLVLDQLYSTDTEELDTAVFDAKRLFPACGTWKRKGAHNPTSGRVHRPSHFLPGAETPDVLSADEVKRLLGTFEARLIAEQRAAVEKGMGSPGSRSATAAGVTSTRTGTGESDLAKANAVPVSDVVRKLGLDPDRFACPACGATANVDSLEGKGVNIIKCPHATCGGKAWRPVDLVARLAFNCDDLKGSKGVAPDVLRWFADNFGLDIKRSKKPSKPTAEEKAEGDAEYRAVIAEMKARAAQREDGDKKGAPKPPVVAEPAVEARQEEVASPEPVTEAEVPAPEQEEGQAESPPVDTAESVGAAPPAEPDETSVDPPASYPAGTEPPSLSDDDIDERLRTAVGRSALEQETTVNALHADTKKTKGALRARLKELEREHRQGSAVEGEKAVTWSTDLSRSADGTPRGSIANALLVLANDEAWSNVLAYDEFAEASVFRKAPPWDPDVRPSRSFREGSHVEEEDAARLVTWLDRHWQVRISTAMAHEIIEVVGRRNAFHPVQEWLLSLKWDRVERIAGRTGPGWLTRYAGAADTPYHRNVSRWVMRGAVERVLSPGCKCDTMLILESLQGKKKSTLFNALFGDTWFSDTLSEIGTKDSYQDLRGKWGIEMSELDQLNRVEATTAKKFIAKKYDNYRASYGRRNRDVPRQCIFVGSTNADEYLKDWTGNRRYWPVRCGSAELDIAGILRDRDQLFAEAVHLRTLGERWWPEGDEVALCEVEQEQRRQRDSWEDTLARKLDETDINLATTRFLFTLLGIADDIQNRGHETRLGQVMRAIGWEKAQRRTPGGKGAREYIYLRPGTAADAAETQGAGMAVTDETEDATVQAALEAAAGGASPQGASQPSQPVSGSPVSMGGDREDRDIPGDHHVNCPAPSYARTSDQVVTVVTPSQIGNLSSSCPVTTSATDGSDGVVTVVTPESGPLDGRAPPQSGDAGPAPALDPQLPRGDQAAEIIGLQHSTGELLLRVRVGIDEDAATVQLIYTTTCRGEELESYVDSVTDDACMTLATVEHRRVDGHVIAVAVALRRPASPTRASGVHPGPVWGWAAHHTSGAPEWAVDPGSGRSPALTTPSLAAMPHSRPNKGTSMREITNELQVEHPAHARRLELLRANHSTLSMAMSVVEDRNAVGVLLFDPLDPLVLTMELVTPEWQQRAAGNWAEAGSYHPLVGTPVNRQELAEMVGVVRPWIGEALTHDAEDGATWTVVIAFGDITLAACTFPLATPAGQA